MTELRPLYLEMDTPLLLGVDSIAALQKIICCAIECYEAFDSVILDTDLIDIVALKARIDAYAQSGEVSVALLRGMRTNLRSVLSTILDEHRNLFPEFLGVERSEVRRLMQLAYSY